MSNPSGDAGASAEVEVFTFARRHVRVIQVDGKPWFDASDVCEILGYSRARDALRMLDPEDRGAHIVRGADGQNQSIQMVTEPGLYDLVLRSRRPDAREFKRWVTREVLPAIRRTGSYSIPQARAELTRIEILEMALESERRALAAEANVRELEPSAQAWDVLASTNSDYSVREAAHILNRDPDIDTGQQRLFQILRDFGVIDARNRPYASHAAHARLRPMYYLHPETGEKVPAQPQVRLTVAGLRYLHRKLGGREPLHLADGRGAVPTPGATPEHSRKWGP